VNSQECWLVGTVTMNAVIAPVRTSSLSLRVTYLLDTDACVSIPGLYGRRACDK
jgi:hypothetical protein